MAMDRARPLSGDEALEQSALRLCRAGRRDRRSEDPERPLPRLLVVRADEILLSDLRRRAARRLPPPLPQYRGQRSAWLQTRVNLVAIALESTRNGHRRPKTGPSESPADRANRSNRANARFRSSPTEPRTRPSAGSGRRRAW